MQGRSQELSTTTGCYGTGCELWELCSLILVPHPSTLHRALLGQLLSGMFPTGSTDETTPDLGPVAVPRPPLSQIQPKLSPPQPTHGPAAGIAVTVLSRTHALWD